jgi:predicted Zn finger-like uncharacterized protein
MLTKIRALDVSVMQNTIRYMILGLTGVISLMIGGGLLIWAFHYLLWNPPGNFLWHLPDEIALVYPIVTPLGLFLRGFGLLLIVVSGVGLALTIHAEPDSQDVEEDKPPSVVARCPHCSASYYYQFSETETARTVRCQNCGRQFEVVKASGNSDATR